MMWLLPAIIYTVVIQPECILRESNGSSHRILLETVKVHSCLCYCLIFSYADIVRLVNVYIIMTIFWAAIWTLAVCFVRLSVPLLVIFCSRSNKECC